MKKSVIAMCLTVGLTLMFAACGTTSTKTTTPTYVVAADAMNGTNIEVFAINQSSSALTSVSGSPYNFSLSGPDGSIVTHPNGKWVYVCDWSSNNVVALGIDNTAGTPTKTNSVTDTGACDWSGSMAITPAGKFVYTADFNSNVTAFSVDASTGALTVVGSLAAANPGQRMNMVTATDSYVYAADETSNLYIMKIGSDGSLGAPTVLATTATTIYSVQVDRSQKFLYVAGVNGTYGFLGYSIASNGSLTSLGSAVTPAGMGSVSQMVFSGDNKFMYAADSSTGVRGFSFSATGAITEIAGSPFNNSSKDADSVAMDPTGKFLFADDNCTNVYGWVRDSSTGVLSGGAPTTTAGQNVCQLTVTWK